MPRFGAENVPNALQEQMWRQMLGDAAFSKEPMSGIFDLEEFNPNFPSNYVPPGPNEFVPQDMGPYRVVPPQGRMDDSKSPQQRNVERRAANESYLYSTPKEPLNPFHYNNPPANMDELGDARGATTMNRMYNQMPPNIPRYPGMSMPAPDESMQMDQLMQFYTNEDI